MIDFTAVSREIRSLVARRRGLLTFLGSVFAALGLFLNNALQGTLPPLLKDLQSHLFAAYGLMLLVPSVILALRLAKLNAGMALNGVLYARLMRDQTFTHYPVRPEDAARPRFFSVSFLMFLLADLLAAGAATLTALALDLVAWKAPLAGLLVLFVLGLAYARYHRRATTFALGKAATDTCSPPTREDWEAHSAASLEDVNQDMIGILALVGLLVFSAFEGLSGLGKAARLPIDLQVEDVLRHGPLVYAGLMVQVSALGLLTYLRLRLAVGHVSLQLDPTDRPFRILKLTDSLLGYLLLAFLAVVSAHMLGTSLGLPLEHLLPLDGGVFVLAVLVEQATVFAAGRRAARVQPKPEKTG